MYDEHRFQADTEKEKGGSNREGSYDGGAPRRQGGTEEGGRNGGEKRVSGNPGGGGMRGGRGMKGGRGTGGGSRFVGTGGCFSNLSAYFRLLKSLSKK